MIGQILKGNRHSDCLKFLPLLHCLNCKILSRPVATSYQISERCWKKIRHSGIPRYLKFSVSSFHVVGLLVELEEKVPQLQSLYFVNALSNHISYG